MGVLQDLASNPLVEEFQKQGLISRVFLSIGGFLLACVVLNVLKQTFWKNPNEPPMVFHWFPFVGSTITYGMDPPRFFQENRKRVCWPAVAPGLVGFGKDKTLTPSLTVWRCLHLCSAWQENHRRGRTGW